MTNIHLNTKGFSAVLLMSLSVLLSIITQSTFAQINHPGTGTIAPCGSCVPNGWTLDMGSPDVSDATQWGFSAGAWTKPIPAIPNGETRWLTAHSTEVASMEITGLTVGVSYTLEFYYMAATVAAPALGGYGGQLADAIRYSINGGAVISRPIAAEATWYKELATFTANGTTAKFTFYGGDHDAPFFPGNATTEGDLTNISFKESGVQPTPPSCPTPTVTVTPQSTTICKGDPVTFTAAGADSTYFWAVSNSYGNPLTYNPPASTMITVKGYSKGGCNASANAFIVVNDPPVVDVNDVAICPGQNGTLTASGADAYQWSPGTNLSATAGQSVTANPSSPMTYTVTGVTNGCEATAVANVTITSLAASNAGTDITICTGLTGNIGAAPSGGNTYSWSPTTGLSDASVANPSVTLTNTTSAPVVHTYTVTTNPGPCQSTDVVNVTVKPQDDASFSYTPATVCKTGGTNPVPSPPITAGGTYSCSNASLVLNTTTGVIDLSSPIGTYTVTYATTGMCPDTKTTTISLVNVPDAKFSYAGPYCANAANPSPTFAGGSAGVFSETTGGLKFVSTATGEVNLATSTPGTYTVKNEIAGSGSCPPASDTYTITINPIPTVTSTNDTKCSGVAATLTASGADDYTWSDGATTGSTLTKTLTATQSFTVTGTRNGCTSIGTGTITINQAPVITVNSGTVCQGGSVNLVPAGATSYSWADGSSASSRTETPPTSTTYNVTGTTNNCTSAPVTASITVNQVPVVGVVTQNICAGQNATITATGATTYIWTDNPTAGNPRTVNPASTTPYTVVGAIGTCTATATGTVVVSNGSSLTAQSKTICSGQTTTLTANGGASYTWSTGQPTQSISVNPPTSTTYTVSDNSVPGCPATTTVSVTVVATPTVTVNNPFGICEGQSATITASGANSYAWNTGALTTFITVTPTTAMSTYTVTGTIGNCISSAVSTVTMNLKPVVTVSPDSVCPGTTVTLNAGSTAGVTFLWSTGQAGNSINVTPTQTTNYTVVASFAGCTTTSVAKAYVHANPVAAFEDPRSYSISEANVNFVDKSTGAAQWLWDFGDASPSASSNLQNPTHQYSDTGTYIVSLLVTSPFGCVDSISHDLEIDPDLFIYIPNAFTPNENDRNDGFGAKGVGIQPDGFVMRVFDRWGQLVFTSKDINEYWDGKYKGAPAQEDVYVYLITIKTAKNKEKTFKGWVSLVR